jgi:ATP/maltotriose-dependent transcriptional regulator MalT
MQQDPLLKTKLYIPPLRPETVSRPRLIERLNAGLHRKMTLISAPAGFGKTTLWPAGQHRGHDRHPVGGRRCHRQGQHYGHAH